MISCSNTVVELETSKNQFVLDAASPLLRYRYDILPSFIVVTSFFTKGQVLRDSPHLDCDRVMSVFHVVSVAKLIPFRSECTVLLRS